MKRRKLPSFKEHAEEHHKRTNAYVARHVSRLSEEMVRDTIRTLELLGIELSQDEALSLMDYPALRQPLLNIRKRYAQGLETAIVNGAVREWAESNNLQDLFVRRVLKERGQDERAERFIHYFKPNTEARNAFIKRKEQGLGLSDKVWNVSGLMQSNLEQALATAIEDGWDAVTLSKRVSQYLRDFPTMQRDYRLRYGRASRIEDAEYRSARLARTEINMAYRRAEQLRWADMDFVVGYEIKRSGRGYSCSVCDALAGKYPKDFVWHTWHPNCRCYAVPILNTDDEFFASPLEAKGTNASPSINEVTDTPEGFRSWLSTNEHRIVQARERGTLPYFIRYNPKYSSPQVIKKTSYWAWADRKFLELREYRPFADTLYKKTLSDLGNSIYHRDTKSIRTLVDQLEQQREALEQAKTLRKQTELFGRELLESRQAKGNYITQQLGKSITIDDVTYTHAYITDKQVLHATRDTKQEKGKTLSLEEFLGRISKDFSTFDEWRYDERNDSYITAVHYLDDSTALKYVFKIHKKIEGVRGKEKKLHFITAGVVEATNVTQYKKID